ncbi:shikimate dehydrogenase [Actibacterium pelagium]|uniref:Shikimate dehydrogenase (NADP(+)) n=1 Tax=Actibacterium pelagium TaxID=2029103 RepID=A0A917EK25_9RHOB|nr:shikimate dehydrogenase [Actibacterium pelagium]GGE55365.1 shikimate dehydrogenase (NADP(+)) [Actibacterium pelagium]
MSERIPLAGVIGSPIAHSKSPKLQNYWLSRYGIEGYYIPMDISQSDLAEVLRMLPRQGFVGVNVTIPHKEAALSLADTVTDRAALIGAANTLTFGADGKIIADNTDGYGFLENLRQNGGDWDPSSGPAAVLGAGGASRAVISALLDAGAPEIRLANRTKARAEALRQDFGSRVEVYDWVQTGAMLEGVATLVNTTSLGMTGKAELKISLENLPTSALVNDIVYSPLMTPLLTEAQARGNTVVDGLGMLLYQATPGFERWFGQKPEVDETTRLLVLGE